MCIYKLGLPSRPSYWVEAEKKFSYTAYCTFTTFGIVQISYNVLSEQTSDPGRTEP